MGVFRNGNETMNGYPIGKGAVLYRENTDRQTDLWHVLGVYDERNGSSTYVRLACGTHTEYDWLHIDDVREMFTPAGWSVDTKPTYILTRSVGHKAHPKDFMRQELYQ